MLSNISNNFIVLITLPRPPCGVLMLNCSSFDIQNMFDVVSSSDLGGNVVDYRFHYPYLIRHPHPPDFSICGPILGEIISVRLIDVTDGFVFLH